MSLGQAGKPGNADGQFNQPNDVVDRARRQHLRL